ncbi:MAG: bifunctional oligoribonuclease/PAP phosphatase NrnA [Candidatus Berkelbacteria bacterium]
MQNTNKIPINKAIARFINADKILLIIHENPDGDTLAAATVIYTILKKMGKSPAMVCKDQIPKPFLFLPEVNEIKHDLLFGDYDVITVIDCGDIKRTGFAERLKKFALTQKKTLINIDHHPKNDLHKIANINVVDQSVSSTSEIVYELCVRMNVEFDKNMATALLTGIYTDTGGFKHSNTSKQTLEIAGELLKNGGKIKLITQNISLNKTVPAMKLWGLALKRMHRNNNLGIVSSVITREDLVLCNACDDDLAGVVNLINTVPDSKAAILFHETSDNKIKASVRTESDRVDVSKIAAVFGGGGHKKAAGFTIDGRLEILNDSWRIVLK